MRQKLSLVLLLVATTIFNKVSGQQCQNIVYIPDANLKAALVRNTNINTDGDNEICESEAQAYTGKLLFLNENIADARGLEAFTQATELLLYDNPSLTNLDVSNNVALKNIAITNAPLTSLDFSNNTELINLYCYNNSLTSLDISKNTKLTTFSCTINPLTSLDVSNNTALKRLDCSYNKLTSLDVSNNTALERLECNNNNLTSLNLGNNNSTLTHLKCYQNNLTSLDVSNNTALQELECYNNQLTNLNLSNNNTDLSRINCSYNNLVNLDTSNTTALEYLSCNNNKLTSFNTNNNTALQFFYCGYNQLTSLDTSNNTALLSLGCTNNQLTSLNVANGNNINMDLMAEDNPNLTCIQTDASIVGTSPAYWSKDAVASYSVNCSLGIDDIELDSQEVSIYPNPVLDILHVSLKHSDVKSVTVYNVLGAVVLQSTETSIGVQTLPSGVYVVKVEDIKGRKFASKVVKK